MPELDPLELLLKEMRDSRAPKMVTSYSADDVRGMIHMLHQCGLTPEFREDVDEVRCPCPFHDNHGSPTLWVNFGRADDLPHGSFKCFSCGTGGLWNKLERRLTGKDEGTLGQKYDAAEMIQIIEPRKAKDIYIAPTFLLPLDDDFVWEHPDGNFPKEFLDGLGAKLAVRTWYVKSVKQQFSELRLWLPVYDGHDLVGDILAALERPGEDAEDFIKDDFRKYINSTALESKETLWPFPHVVKNFGNDYVVLVEGPADAMRLLLNGIPALAILGTGTWSESKADKLYFTFDTVVTCFDGDKAGRSVTESVIQSLHMRLGDKLLPIWLPDDFDPGKFTAEDCQWLRDKIQQRINNVGNQ